MQFRTSKLWQAIAKCEETKAGRLTVIWCWEELEEDSFGYNLIGEEQEFEVVVVSHWLQVVGSWLLLRHVEIFLLPAGHVS